MVISPASVLDRRPLNILIRCSPGSLLGGAIYVSAICVLPTILSQKFHVSFYFGGTSLLIVVGVALDTVQQIEAHMLSRHYEGLMRKGRLKGRRG